MKYLTKKQKQTLEYIQRYIGKKNYAPSLEEISDHFHISITSAWERIRRLVEKRYLEKQKFLPRAIKQSKLKKILYLLTKKYNLDTKLSIKDLKNLVNDLQQL